MSTGGSGEGGRRPTRKKPSTDSSGLSLKDLESPTPAKSAGKVTTQRELTPRMQHTASTSVLAAAEKDENEQKALHYTL